MLPSLRDDASPTAPTRVLNTARVHRANSLQRGLLRAQAAVASYQEYLTISPRLGDPPRSTSSLVPPSPTSSSCRLRFAPSLPPSVSPIVPTTSTFRPQRLHEGQSDVDGSTAEPVPTAFLVSRDGDRVAIIGWAERHGDVNAIVEVVARHEDWSVFR